jgi:hypothetical protein
VLIQEVLLNRCRHLDLSNQLVSLFPGFVEERRPRCSQSVERGHDAEEYGGQYPVTNDQSPTGKLRRAKPLAKHDAETSIRVIRQR